MKTYRMVLLIEERGGRDVMYMRGRLICCKVSGRVIAGWSVDLRRHLPVRGGTDIVAGRSSVVNISQGTQLVRLAVTPLLMAASLAAQPPQPLNVEGGHLGAVAAGDSTSESALLIVHDWFGITEFTEATLERFADRGFYAVAVDLYGGASASTHAEAGALMQDLNQNRVASTVDQLDSLIGRLSESRRLAVMGFSMGGSWAFGAALRNPEQVDAAVIVYGGGMESSSDEALSRLTYPPLLVTGSKDAWALGSMMDILPRLDEHASGAELYVFPGARHAYSQPLYAEGANLDAEATRMTWLVVDNYLDRVMR